jgi:hypothetical protein
MVAQSVSVAWCRDRRDRSHHRRFVEFTHLGRGMNGRGAGSLEAATATSDSRSSFNQAAPKASL